ncbi:MAG TPA: hypothetical protein VGJ95_24600 [Pseudonocardiaceae bacterium]|jgi:hypothetical protein
MTSPHDGRVGGAADLAVTAPAVSSPPGGGAAGVPLTERILSRLPGPRLVWMLVWALVPWLNLVAVRVLGAADWAGTGAPPVGEVFNRTAVSCAILLSLWGAARITDNLRRVGVALTEVVEQDEGDVRALFRGMGSTVGPLLLTAAGVLVLPLDEALTGEPRAALIQFPLRTLLDRVPAVHDSWHRRRSDSRASDGCAGSPRAGGPSRAGCRTLLRRRNSRAGIAEV